MTLVRSAQTTNLTGASLACHESPQPSYLQLALACHEPPWLMTGRASFWVIELRGKGTKLGEGKGIKLGEPER